MPGIATVARKAGRTLRAPDHPFNVSFKPFVLQPIAIAPVLPGETMTHLLWQARAQTEQLSDSLIGWHLEFYWFYVKLSQLDTPEEWIAPGTGMLMNPEYDASGLAGAAEVRAYHEDTGSINYVKRCRDIVVREYFRDDGQDETDGLIDTTDPLVYFKRPGWMDSVALTSELVAASPNLPDDAANATMREVERLQQQWEMLNAMGITDMTYEDFLATFGIGQANVNSKKPEILRWAKYWQLPATAVDGATGTTSSVVSWKVEGRADKDRLFREHGFVCGYVCARPKTYYAHQRTAAVSMLNSAFAWAPRMFDTQFAGVTVKDFADGAGPLYDGVTEGYTVDTKDLFLYGDQFVNHDFSAYSLGNRVGPAGNVPDSKIINTNFIDSLFVAANTTNKVLMDGIAHMSVKSVLRDTTPSQLGRVVLPLTQ